MPIVYETNFQVRHYECDAYGHLNNAVYLSYMQESAYQASAAVGYDMVSYHQMDTVWLIRETQVEYLLPVYYGDVLEVRTWVADFRRVRSKRMYEIRRQASQELVCRGYSDWVYLDRQDERPRTIPVEMKAAFMPEHAKQAPAARQPFPAPPAPPPGVLKVRRQVEWRDLDPVRHVNNAVYAQYLQECGMQLGQTYGWPAERMWQEGFAIVARSHHIEYLKPAFLGEQLEILTWLSPFNRTNVVRHYLIRRELDGELLTQVNSRYVWVDLDTGHPIRIPEKIKRDFASNVSEEVR